MVVLKGSKADVLSDLYIINQIAAAWWASQGYTVINNNGVKELVPQVNGEDAPTACRTTTWDVPKQAGNEWYIASPSEDKRFSLWRDYLPPGYEVKCVEADIEIEAVTY